MARAGGGLRLARTWPLLLGLAPEDLAQRPQCLQSLPEDLFVLLDLHLIFLLLLFECVLYLERHVHRLLPDRFVVAFQLLDEILVLLKLLSEGSNLVLFDVCVELVFLLLLS